MLVAVQKQRGITMVELLIAITILAILLTLAVPSFTVWLQNNQIRTANESIVNGLQLARAEAVRRNMHVSFILGVGSTWRVETGDGGGGGTVIQSRASTEGSPNVTAAITGGSIATFNELGRIVNTATMPTQIDLASSVLPASQSRNLRINITAGGQIRSCDPMFSGTDPRAC